MRATEQLGSAMLRQPSGDIDRARIQEAISSYVDEIRSTGMVWGLLVGTNPNEGGSYLWNILTHNLSQKSLADSRLGRLSHSGYELRRELSSLLTVRIAFVEKPRLQRLVASCSERGIQTEVFPF